MDEITVVVPTIPVRPKFLNRAVASIAGAASELERQLGVTARLALYHDFKREGAPATRHRGLMAVKTPWVAFLDDDDVMHTNHLVQLYSAAVSHQADYVWSRFQICFPDGRVFQGPQFLGDKAFSQWNDDDPCQTTVTTLVRTELAQDAGGFLFDDDESTVDGNRRGEDHVFTLRCRKAGARMRHVEQVTWDWWHHESNTSGLPIW